MAGPPKTISGKPQTAEPEEYEKGEGLLTPHPVIPQKPQRAHSRDRTLTRRISMMTLSDYKFAGESRQRSLSAPAPPPRSFSALSNPLIYRDSALPDHDNIVPQSRGTSTLALPEGTSCDDINCVPVTPAHIMKKKYRRNHFIRQTYGNEVPTIQALQTKFSSAALEVPDTLGFHWQTYEAPEGNIYFREITANLVTFVDMFNEKYRSGVCACASIVLNQISLTEQNLGSKMPADSEIVIMLEDYNDGGGYGYGYYLANWKERRLFWSEDVKYEFITQDARICLTESHIAKKVEQLFWIHAEMFPCHHTLSSDVVKQLKKAMNLGLYDHITSDNSIFPYDKEDATEILKCLDRVDSPGSGQDASDVWIIARCKQNLEEYRFLNYHGERGARIHRFDSVERESIRSGRSILFYMVTPLLFFMPSVYMNELEGLWIDETVDWISWRRFVSILDKDWNQSMTPAAVILSANIGFLAIGSVDNANSDGSVNAYRNAAQIASYISSILSFFFFVTVQILTNQHRLSQYYTAEKACAFLERRSKRWLGLESVAMTYSLPTSLFIWSMLALLAALMIVFFWKTDVVTRALMSVAVGILLIVSAILLWLDWDNHSKFNEEYDSNSSESDISLLKIICRLRGFNGIASSIRNQRRGTWRWKGVFRFARAGERNRSNHSGNASDTTSDTAVSYTGSSEKLP